MFIIKVLGSFETINHMDGRQTFDEHVKVFETTSQFIGCIHDHYCFCFYPYVHGCYTQFSDVQITYQPCSVIYIYDILHIYILQYMYIGYSSCSSIQRSYLDLDG